MVGKDRVWAVNIRFWGHNPDRKSTDVLVKHNMFWFYPMVERQRQVTAKHPCLEPKKLLEAHQLLAKK